MHRHTWRDSAARLAARMCSRAGEHIGSALASAHSRLVTTWAAAELSGVGSCTFCLQYSNMYQSALTACKMRGAEPNDPCWEVT